MSTKRTTLKAKESQGLAGEILRVVKPLRSGTNSDRTALAADALRLVYYVASELHAAQCALNGRFVASEKPGRWDYLPEPIGAVPSEPGSSSVQATGAWWDVVQALPMFRRAIDAAGAMLPQICELMDSPQQAIPDRWTFRTRIDLAELEGVYGHEQAAREILKARGYSGNDASEFLRCRPMDEKNLQRFGELVSGFRLRCIEIQFAKDLAGSWKLPPAPGDRAPLSNRERAVWNYLGELPSGQARTGEQIVQALSRATPAVHISPSALTKDIIPKLRPWGVRNRRGVGYYIELPGA